MIHYVKNCGKATIGIESPYNAFDRRTLQSFMEALEDVSKDLEIRVVLIQGEKGRFFCTGANPSEFKNYPSQVEFSNLCRMFTKMISKVASLPQITIAKVQGKAAGSGVSLAAACDRTIGLDGCSFRMSETLFGFDPMIVADPLIRRMGNAQTQKMLMYPARFLTSDEAYQYGLLDQVCASETELELEIRKMLEELSFYNSKSVRYWKAENPFLPNTTLMEERIKTTADIFIDYHG